MSHSFDKTLLARLGFQDPDKKNPLHEIACHYLAENAGRLADYISPRGEDLTKHARMELVQKCWACRSGMDHGDDGAHSMVDSFGWRERPTEEVLFRRKKKTAVYEFERWIHKGDGQYRVDIGRLDLLVRSVHEYEFPGRYGVGEWVASDQTKVRDLIAIEVKIGRVTVSDVIAQIGLYRAHFDATHWVLAAPFKLNKFERSALENEQIKFLELGPKFQEFCAEYEAESSK